MFQFSPYCCFLKIQNRIQNTVTHIENLKLSCFEAFFKTEN